MPYLSPDSFLYPSVAIAEAARGLHEDSEIVHTQRWQGMDISKDPRRRMCELLNVSFTTSFEMATLVHEVKPNLPWADEHFLERISGKPLNPPPSHVRWPYAQKANADHVADEKFSHTYPERMWPKYAGQVSSKPVENRRDDANFGIRYEYGDLKDVVALLAREPDTRQAFLPIWFPEDTGAVQGQRVPCTIGYHFIRRNAEFHCVYYIRSCDYIRHFRDDIYLACKLANWVAESASKVEGSKFTKPNFYCLTMHITSLHCWESERNLVTSR